MNSIANTKQTGHPANKSEKQDNSENCLFPTVLRSKIIKVYTFFYTFFEHYNISDMLSDS